MPYLEVFRTNEELLQEVLRVKSNRTKPVIPPKTPNKVKTTKPAEVFSVSQWFEHIAKQLRVKNLFGVIEYPVLADAKWEKIKTQHNKVK
jgi:hypothetical protein